MFKITSQNNTSSVVFYSESESFSGVKKIADKVRLDVQRVTGVLPENTETLPAEGNVVVYGTIGKSPVLNKLATEGKIKLKEIEGKNEVYSFSVVDSDKLSMLVIAGSDKRGTIYGLFHLSELMGVSPLVEWCDVLPEHKDSIELDSSVNTVSKEPSVRFRGFFINDEWPAYGNWTNKNFGGFNAKMYEHVFELLLRLKGNYLWPAMWAARFSDDGPDLANAELADELGVVMGASHHEPCCRAGEEYRYLRGPGSVYGDAWNFRSNEAGITEFWEDGLKRNGKFENVITVGMRGEADTAIMQNATLKDNIDLLRDVIRTQNNLIRKYVNEDVNKVPRMLALYKEVEPYFYGDKKTKGLIGDPELDGVTLMLCDDNHGNLRTVPTKEMRNHKGGYGMYYHFDYHGSPYSYEWFNTSYLPKVKEQMTQAYDFGIRDLWIVNVGDILTNEFPLSYFLNLAYDYETFSQLENTTQNYTKEWIAAQYPFLNEEQKKATYEIIDGYTKLTHKRRTECLQPDTYHPVNYNESDDALAQAEEIIAKCEKLKNEISAENWPGFFTQVYLPACGNMNVLRMQLYSGKNHWMASKGLIASSWYADKVRECYAYDKAIVAECDSVANGKWHAMGWSEHFGFKHWCEAENRYPVYMTVEPTRKKRIAAWVDGANFTTSGQDWTIRTLHIDAFKNPECTEAVVKVANCNEGTTDWKLEYATEESNRWFTADVTGGKVYECPEISNIVIKIDRSKLAGSANKTDVLKITGNDGHGARILVEIKIDAAVPECNFPSGTFVQTTNYISMEAEHFVISTNCGENKWEILPGYGKTLSAAKVFPVTEKFPKAKNAPVLEYAFAVGKEGNYSIDFYINPSNPVAKDNLLQFAMDVNGKLQIIDTVPKTFAVGDNQEPWGTDVTNSIRIVSTIADCQSGLNKLKVMPVTPGFVLEKITIYPAGSILPQSYLGPKETYRVK